MLDGVRTRRRTAHAQPPNTNERTRAAFLRSGTACAAERMAERV